MKYFFCFLFSAIALLGEGLSLAELIDIGLKNNPETERAWASTKRSQAALGISKSACYPLIGVNGTVSHGRELKYPNGPNTVFTNYGGEVCLTYLLFDCGERSATVDAMKEALLASKWFSDFAMQQVIYKVTASYYEYLSAIEILEMKEKTLKDAKLVHDSAEELCKAGLRRVGDLNLSRAEVAQIQMDVAQQKCQMKVAYGKLMTSVGVPIETKWEIKTDWQPMQNRVFSEGVSELIKVAEEQRADLAAKKAQLAEMRQRVKQADRAPYPKMRALGQGGWLQYNHHHGSSFNYNVGLALEIPIFKGFEYSYNKQLALANAETTLAELRELQDAIALEVMNYSESVNAAQEALKWSEEYLSESVKSYEGSMESYKAGLQNIFDLIQSQRFLGDARVRKAVARTQWLVSLAELAFATGGLAK